MFWLTICEFFGHKVDPRRVWHDGLNYRTKCRRCGSNLLRQSSGWVIFDPAAHADDRRETKSGDA